MSRRRGPQSLSERTAALQGRRMPGGAKTWYDVATEEATREGALIGAVLTRRTPAAVRARHAAWLRLRAAGYSTPEIGAGWGFDPGTVLEAVGETARSRRANEGAPVGAYDVAADLENIF